MNIPETTHKMGGGWGGHITWMDEQEKVYGHMRIHPKVGDTLCAEFTKSIMIFEFTDIEGCRDPRDMFFGDVRLLERIPRDEYKDEVEHIKVVPRIWWQIWKPTHVIKVVA